jgi:uncharacterized membrane protein
VTLPRIVLVAAIVLTGLSAGFFYSYEASVTLGLAEVDAPTYVAAFQAINDSVRNPAFGVMFFGAIPVIAVALALHWRQPPVRTLIGAALVLYLALIVVTGTGNVPLNEQLAEYASIDASIDAATAATARDEFEDDWNRLNLIRTVAVVASFVLLALAATSPVRQEADRDDRV